MARCKVPPDEDTWSWVEIGDPFPEGPLRVKGEQNQYVALWYKHGKPICGRAWNNNGVVECSFGYSTFELTGKKDLGGKIQILTYPTWMDALDAWKKHGYWYDWVPWRERMMRGDKGQMVRCGDAAPVLANAPDGNTYCGNMEISTETAVYGYNGKADKKTTHTGDMLTLLRVFTEPPVVPKTKDNLWGDVKEGDEWSRVGECISAMGRPLKGPIPNPVIALWYCDGNPIFGAAWSEGGKIRASFGARGHEYKDKVGSLQILTFNPDKQSFQISWKPYRESRNAPWRPCKVADCAPCVITDKGQEFLGRCLVSEEKASYPDNGKEVTFVGPQVQNFMVLCRTD